MSSLARLLDHGNLVATDERGWEEFLVPPPAVIEKIETWALNHGY